MQRKLIFLIAITCLILFAGRTNAQMNGIYSIGPSAPIFKTITQAAVALYYNGVVGPVTFNIENGVYNEQVFIPPIYGTSVYNLVTFQSLSGDSSKVIIKFKPKNDTFNYTLMLDGSNYIVFKKLTFATDTIFGRVIDINNMCSYNLFINNRILGMPGSKELVYSKDTANSIDNNNWFENNLFKYGSVGISFSGVDTSIMEEGTEIYKNIFIDQSQQAIDLKYTKKFKIRNNSISSSVGTSDYTGIRIRFCRDKFSIEQNKLDIDNQLQSSHGIAIIFSDGTSSTNASSIFNNFIHISSNTYIYVAGIEILSSFKNIYYNSVNITGNNVASIAFNEIKASDLNIMNNIFSNPAKGISLILNDTSNIFCNYNDIYSMGIDMISSGPNYYSTLADWRSASKKDVNSISSDPGFYSNADLHVNNIMLSKKGKAVSGIIYDIDGNKRKSPKSDMGADEFSYKMDLGPDRYVCAGSSITILADEGFDTYSWSNGDTNGSITVDSTGVGLGTLKVKLTTTYMGSCFSDSVLVHFIKAYANIGSDKAFCEDEPVTLYATGGVKFKWNTGDTLPSINFTAKQSSRYSVRVSDQYGCTDSASVRIFVRSKPAAPSIILVGTDSLRSSVFASSYTWFLNKSKLSDKTISIKPKVSGNYQLIVSDSACPSDTSIGIDFKMNSINKARTEAKIRLYPNPVTNILIIETTDFDFSGSEIEIKSALGENIYYSDHIFPKIEIETSAFKKGLYILKFVSNGQTLIKRFVVQ